MIFKEFLNLFELLLSLKKQYPILFSYYTYLTALSETDQDKEMNTFVIWLGSNPQISKKILNNPKFTSPAKGKLIYFDVIFKIADKELTKKIWAALQHMCQWVDTNYSVNLAFNKLQHNTMVQELIKDLDLDDVMNKSDFDNLQIDDIDNILFSPQLIPTLSKLKDVVCAGKYDYTSFLPIIQTTIHDLKNSKEIDDTSIETLTVLDDELGNLKKGKNINYTKIIDSLKKDPLINKTKFSSFLNGFSDIK